MSAMDPSKRPHYRVQYGGRAWLRINYDTGAAATALPLEFGDGLALRQVGEFKVASGDAIPNYGRVRFQSRDEAGLSRKLTGNVAQVHKPLGSAAEISRRHDAFIWEDGGALVPRNNPIALGLRKEFYHLLRIYGGREVLQLHREGRLYNF